ncbi:hypothetical protein [Pseudomonas sp. Hp2]|uniref:hypothetical protein n=1 Tax=Pseudomonas sp. Hp2 TaxID=701189 RepID=UPI00112714C1|nr:hypothetical protein [Pseudomonas sp. Hp2]
MLDSISALLEIGEKAPPAIDYFYMPPRPQWVPDIALKKAHQDREFLLSVVGLHNLSSKVLSSIRVKLPFAPQYDPIVDVFGASAGISASYESSNHVVQIARLDPSEKIYVAIFLSSAESSRFTEPQVIVGERLLSRGMRAVGYFKKRPKEVLLFGGLLVSLFSSLAFVGYAAYQVSSLNPRTKALNEAIAGISGFGCVPTAYEKSQVNQSLLARHRLGEPFLFRLNNVVTHKDLFEKEYIIICQDR